MPFRTTVQLIHIPWRGWVLVSVDFVWFLLPILPRDSASLDSLSLQLLWGSALSSTDFKLLSLSWSLDIWIEYLSIWLFNFVIWLNSSFFAAWTLSKHSHMLCLEHLPLRDLQSLPDLLIVFIIIDEQEQVFISSLLFEEVDDFLQAFEPWLWSSLQVLVEASLSDLDVSGTFINMVELLLSVTQYSFYDDLFYLFVIYVQNWIIHLDQLALREVYLAHTALSWSLPMLMP